MKAFITVTLVLVLLQAQQPALACDLPMFAGARLFPSANSANVVATGDFNHDGFIDLAVAATGNISILLGNGDGTFQSTVNYPVKAPIFVVVGDFNGDGNPDLAVADSGNLNIQVMLGNGDGTFRGGTITSTPAASMAAGDFNGDGKLDLAISGTPAYILLGKGDGTFQAPIAPPGQIVGGQGVAVGDFNGDSKLDVVTGSATGGIFVLLGDGRGNLAAPKSFGTSSPLSSIAVADLNGDHKLDVVTVSGLDNSVTVLLGSGDGTFQPGPIYPLGSLLTTWVVIADFNGDGNPDLAVTNHASFMANGTISVLLGNGDGTFQPVVQYNPTALPDWTIVAADFNGDGVPDLAFTSIVTGAPTQVGLMLGNGDGTFQSPPGYAAVSIPRSPVMADFNGDGVLDLAVTNAGLTGGLSVFLGNGDGSFQPAVNYPTGFGPKSVAVGDVNGDGKPDLVVANLTGSNLLTFLGNGDGTFQSSVATSTFGGFYVALGDFNNDGKLDAAVVTVSGAQVLLGKGDGTFGGSFSFFGRCLGCGGGPITVADLNGDGNLDLVLANSNVDMPSGLFGSGTVTVLLGNGNGSFQNGVNYMIGTNATSVGVGDVNGDGRPDLVVSDFGGNQINQSGPGALALLLGNGDGTFQTAVRYPAGLGSAWVATGDFNGDGYADVAVASQTNKTISVYLSNGDGTLRNEITYGAGNNPLGLAVGDLNGDGKPDLVTVDDLTNTVLILLNNYIPGSNGSVCAAVPVLSN